MREVLKNFIVLEGLDGAGTTTQKKAIENELNAMGYKTYSTHEPTDNPIGRVVRDVLQSKFKTTPEALAYLYTSDRHDHLYNSEYGLIKHINDGEIIIADRYFFSSIAYQSVECDFDFVTMINSPFPYPELVIFVDTPVADCLSRIEKRGEEKELFDKEEFLTKVRNNYIETFKNLPPEVKFLKVEGSLSIDEIKSTELEFIRSNLSIL